MTTDRPQHLTMLPGSPRKPRTASTFKQRDLTRALRAARAAGVRVLSVAIDKTGRIVLETSFGGVPSTGNIVNEWDAIE